MWFRITDIIVNRVAANHLENPINQASPMVLALFQRESRTVLHVYKPKKVFPQYLETPAGSRIPRRKWSAQMNDFAQQEIAKLPLQKSVRKLTIFGWIFFLFTFVLIGYAIYETAGLPAQKKAYAQQMVEKASVAEGDIYFGRYRIYKEKGNFVGSEGGFGWFKVERIENDTYYIAKSVQMSDIARPKETLNSTEFGKEVSAVKAKKLEAYNKQFISEDGLIEFNLNERK